MQPIAIKGMTSNTLLKQLAKVRGSSPQEKSEVIRPPSAAASLPPAPNTL